MKKLVIVTHPHIDSSKVNKRWLQEVQQFNSEFTVHQLHKVYGDSDPLNVEKEQALLLEHDAVILQFPFYWFGTPPLLKKWLDEVLLPGFADGRHEDDRKLTGKRFGFAISAGIKSEDYGSDGRYGRSVEDFLAPLTATIAYVHARHLAPFVLYGAQYDPTNPEIEDISEAVEASAQVYMAYLRTV